MYRIIQWATGNVGKASLRSIIDTPDFELVGLYVYGADKVGLDAGDICGVGKVGIAATNDLEAILATRADCVVFNGLGDTKDPDTTEQMICRILASGKNVVSTAISRHIHAAAMSPQTRERLEAACREGNSSFFSSGINPGFSADALAFAISAVADRIDHIHCIELVDMAHYTSGQIVHEAIGMGKPADYSTPLENDGPVEENAYYTSALLMQDGFDMTFDEVVRSTEKAFAQEAIECPWGVIEKGTIAGLRMRLRGLVGGKPRFTSDMVWKVTDNVPDDWPTGDSSWIVAIEGDPAINCHIDIESKTGRTVSHVTSAAAFNRVRDVIAAEPGIRTRLDFPLASGGRFPSQRKGADS
jgi:4-hydroxy-tetrahydrodipicolinate reductase